MEEIKKLITSQWSKKILDFYFSHPPSERKIHSRSLSQKPCFTFDNFLSRATLVKWDWDEFFSRRFQKERDAAFNEILTGELKAVNSTLLILNEEGNFTFASLLLREVVRLHTILLLQRIGAGEKIRELL